MPTIVRSCRSSTLGDFMKLILATSLLCALAACSNESVDACASAGAPTVTVSAPSAAPVRVRITEQSGTVHEVDDAGVVMTERAPTILSSRTRTASGTEFVGVAYNPTFYDDSSCGVDLAVGYDLDRASHRLWVTDSGSTAILGIPEASLHASATVAADVSLTGFTNVGAPAFGLDGSLWVKDAGRVHAFAPETLAAGGAEVADIVLSGSSVEGPGVPGPSALAFDSSGNLWISNTAGNSVSRFDANDILRTGEPTASVVISGDAIASPAALAFDRDGNLWIGNADGEVVKYLAARLNANITTAPDVSLQGQTGPVVTNNLGDPQALAFDSDNNLWVGYFGANVVARYTVAERATTGTLRPAVELIMPVDVLLESLAFDDQGGMWLTGAAGTVVRVAPSSLGTDGDATLGTILTVTDLGYASGLAFDPPSASLPIAFDSF